MFPSAAAKAAGGVITTPVRTVPGLRSRPRWAKAALGGLRTSRCDKDLMYEFSIESVYYRAFDGNFFYFLF